MKLYIPFTSLLLLVVLITNKVFAINENELIFNRTSSELINILRDLSNNEYQTNISSIKKKLDECYALYHHTASNNLFFLENLLRQKIINITTSENPNVEGHINKINDGLLYATKVTPSYFKAEALLLLIQIPKLKMNNLISLFHNVSTFTMSDDISISQETNSLIVIPSHPHIQKFLKDSTILFILFAALADICVDPTMTVCPVLILVGLIASGLWIFQINNIFNGIL